MIQLKYNKMYGSGLLLYFHELHSACSGKRGTELHYSEFRIT